MNQHLHLITLGVNDLERSRKFYAETLGWKPASASSDDVTFFQAGGVVLGLYPHEKLAEDALTSPEGSGFAGVTLAYNAKSEAGSGRDHPRPDSQRRGDRQATPKGVLGRI